MDSLTAHDTDNLKPAAKKSLRGFAAMDPQRQREIASLGGRMTTAEGNITSLDGRMGSVEGDITSITTNLSSGTIGMVQQSAAGENLTVGKDSDGAAVDFLGTAGARKLINVADGTLAADSQEAVNGGQLFSTNQDVAQNTADIAGNTAAITGLDGRTLADAWAEGMHTNLGITVAGFPELYVRLGPNTGLGHNSVVLMIELATRYVLDSIERARVAGPAVTTTAVQEAFRREVDERSRHTVWTTGCRSWYLDEHGRNATLWPGSTVSYWWRTRRRRDADFTPLSSPTTTEANRVLAQ